MPKRRLDISPMLAQWGEHVDFFQFAPSTNVNGIVTRPATSTKVIYLAYVAPYKGSELHFDTEGVNLTNSKIVFIKHDLALSEDGENPEEVRMLYDGKVYKLVAKTKYHSKYFVYLATQLRIKPDALS